MRMQKNILSRNSKLIDPLLFSQSIDHEPARDCPLNFTGIIKIKYILRCAYGIPVPVLQYG